WEVVLYISLPGRGLGWRSAVPTRAASAPHPTLSPKGRGCRRLWEVVVYLAVKGGERAIEAAHRLLAEERRGDARVPELDLAQIDQQLSLAVDRVMTEGSLYDRELAAL